MSGPVLQRLEKTIVERGGDAYVLDFVSEGRPITELMRTEFDLSEAMFYRWAHANPDREAAWKKARLDSGHVYAERAAAVLDDKRLDVAPTSAEVSLAKARSNSNQWQASKRNRVDYGDDALVNIHNEITAGSLHLDALLRNGMGQLQRAEPEQIAEAEYELIEGSEFEDLEDTWEG